MVAPTGGQPLTYRAIISLPRTELEPPPTRSFSVLIVLALFAPDTPFGVDLFLVVMVLLVPTMLAGIRLAANGRLQAHRRVMAASYLLFVGALLAFEWAIRTMENRPDIPVLVLTIHLCFAIPGLILWTWQILSGKKAPTEPKRHARRGKIVFALLVATVATGVWVYGTMFS